MTSKRYAGKGVTNYSKDKRTGKYTVRKYVNGKLKHYGTVETEDIAIEYVKALENVEWNTSLLPVEFQKYVPKRVTNGPKYYHKKGDSWIVNKRIDGKTVYFGSYPTEEFAQKIVAQLKKNNWGEDYLSLNGNYSKKAFKKSNSDQSSTGSLSNPKYDVETKPRVKDCSIEGTYNKQKVSNQELRDLIKRL